MDIQILIMSAVKEKGLYIFMYKPVFMTGVHVLSPCLRGSFLGTSAFLTLSKRHNIG